MPLNRSNTINRGFVEIITKKKVLNSLENCPKHWYWYIGIGIFKQASMDYYD